MRRGFFRFWTNDHSELLALLCGGLLNHFKLKTKLLTAKDIREVELPKFSREAQRGPILIEVGDELQSQEAPQIGKTYISGYGPKFDLRIKRKGSAFGHEAGKGVAVEMISMCGVCGPIRIRIMRGDDFYQTCGFRYAVKFANERHHVGHVFNHMTTDNLVEFVVWKRIGNLSQIMNDVRVGPWI